MTRKVEDPNLPPVDLANVRARFPWKKWFARKTLVLIRGTHWKGLAGSFTVTIRKAAALHGKRLAIRVLADGEVLHVTVLPASTKPRSGRVGRAVGR